MVKRIKEKFIKVKLTPIDKIILAFLSISALLCFFGAVYCTIKYFML